MCVFSNSYIVALDSIVSFVVLCEDGEYTVDANIGALFVFLVFFFLLKISTAL